jgi:hypothetical protein
MPRAIRSAGGKVANGQPLTAKQQRDLAALAALPDDRIDTLGYTGITSS